VPVLVVIGITAQYWGTAIGWMGVGTLVVMALLCLFHPGALNLGERWTRRR
jgi:hypothetical protein